MEEVEVLASVVVVAVEGAAEEEVAHQIAHHLHHILPNPIPINNNNLPGQQLGSVVSTTSGLG